MNGCRAFLPVEEEEGPRESDNAAPLNGRVSGCMSVLSWFVSFHLLIVSSLSRSLFESIATRLKHLSGSKTINNLLDL